MLKEIGLLNDRKITFAGNAFREIVDSYPRVIHDLDCTKALGWGKGRWRGSHMISSGDESRLA